MAGFGTLKLAGQMLALSALLHVVALILSGFGPIGVTMLVAAVVFALLAMGLTRGMRRLGYVAFVLVLIGIVTAYAFTGNGPVPNWVLWAIVAADMLALLNLFASLWRPANPG